jgi:hypothetical protein
LKIISSWVNVLSSCAFSRFDNVMFSIAQRTFQS